ncbi:hypothetical protein NDS46_30520 (plasmid) [Paenibacillus thiaminolyticus]|nr:hypothetical protein [Paenibacillus thiaminolyticus]WCF11684.1 hypothetical protein NDS46_30520 [Paenibacillus thiaminolyticus]
MDTVKMKKTVLEMAQRQGWELNPYQDLCAIMEELGGRGVP